jgi:hypothetical protein
VNHHYLGNQDEARTIAEEVQRTGPQEVRSVNNDFQLDRNTAMITLLARIKWLQGYPDQAAAAARNAVEAALKTKHVLSLGYALCMAGCPVALWTGDLTEARRCTDLLREYAAKNGLYRIWGECYERVVRLRQGTEKEALLASYIEPRVDVSTIAYLAGVSPESVGADLSADTEPAEILWSYPEILRVDAELVLRNDSANAEKTAETKLLRSLAFARSQALLAFELRSATSLAELWHRTKRKAKARDLLRTAYDKFTEGFATNDLSRARRLMDELR